MKHSLPRLPLLASVLLTSPLLPSAFGALSLNALLNPVTAPFTGFTAPAIWASTTPASGQLDSDLWSMNADGPLTSTTATFGIDQSGGLGTSTGGVSATGVYAFDVGTGQPALGVQATGTFWSPGMFTLRLQNNTGGRITSLHVEWTSWVYNDQGRSNSFQFLHSGDNATYSTSGPGTDVVSPDLADVTPVSWQANPRSTALTGLDLADGAHYYLRWGGDDVGGSGSRDEFALSNVRITPVPEPHTLGFLILGGLALLPRRR